MLDGGSTGGWVALALQVFYPDFFNGAWSFCPDSVDFRSFQLVNIYEDKNAYINAPRLRAAVGAGCLGRGPLHHAARVPAGERDGPGRLVHVSPAASGAPGTRPTAPGDPTAAPSRSGTPRPAGSTAQAAEHWKAYDLRRILEESWTELGPKLRGKLHIWVGEADDYFLNNAVHRLDAFLSRARPAYEGSITYGPGQGHCWMGISEREMMKQMARRMTGTTTGEAVKHNPGD